MIVACAILKDGVIHTMPKPARHNTIILDRYAKEISLKGTAVQGFLDDAGNFLDRTEAAKHALECGQIERLKFNSHHLFSEDLW